MGLNNNTYLFYGYVISATKFIESLFGLTKRENRDDYYDCLFTCRHVEDKPFTETQPKIPIPFHFMIFPHDSPHYKEIIVGVKVTDLNDGKQDAGFGGLIADAPTKLLQMVASATKNPEHVKIWNELLSGIKQDYIIVSSDCSCCT